MNLSATREEERAGGRAEDLAEDALQIVSPHGRLAARLTYDPEVAGAAGALVLSPHPRLGGDIDNNVLRALAPALARAGLVVLRFDYHGSGGSEGATSSPVERLAYWACDRSGLPEQRAYADAAAAHAWLAAWTHPVHVIGYSFGGALALALAAAELDVDRVVAIAPALGRGRSPARRGARTRPSLVIASDADFATPLSEISALATELGEAAALEVLRGTDHFFRGNESEVARLAVRFLIDRVPGCC